MGKLLGTIDDVSAIVHLHRVSSNVNKPGEVLQMALSTPVFSHRKHICMSNSGLQGKNKPVLLKWQTLVCYLLLARLDWKWEHQSCTANHGLTYTKSWVLGQVKYLIVSVNHLLLSKPFIIG